MLHFPSMLIPQCLVRSSINIDESFQVPHIARPGETLSSTGMIARPGGKGANFAAALGLAGAHVRMLGSVGADATWPLDELRKRCVDLNAVRVSQTQPTGRAFIQIAADGENTIVLLKGANFEADATLDAPAQWLAHATHLMLQNEIPLSTTTNYVMHALTLKDNGGDRRVFTTFNPSPMLSTAEVQQFPWAGIDALIVNEGEAEELLAAFGASAPAGSNFADALARVDAFARVSWLVVTRGGRGVTAAIQLDPATSTARESFDLGAAPASVRDTTGAGDTFAGYLVSGIMQLHSDRTTVNAGIARAEAELVLRTATVAAAIAVEADGAMESIPSADTVAHRIKGLVA